MFPWVRYAVLVKLHLIGDIKPYSHQHRVLYKSYHHLALYSRIVTSVSVSCGFDSIILGYYGDRGQIHQTFRYSFDSASPLSLSDFWIHYSMLQSHPATCFIPAYLEVCAFFQSLLRPNLVRTFTRINRHEDLLPIPAPSVWYYCLRVLRHQIAGAFKLSKFFRNLMFLSS